jgi:dUTP pyrophosphatase
METMFLSDVRKLARQSHAKVFVQCQHNASDRCVGVREVQYRDAMNNIERNDGKYMCIHCSRQIKSIDMEVIDTEEKAYLLGWMATDGTISKSSWVIDISMDKSDVECLETLRDIVCEDLPIKNKTGTNRKSLLICSKQVSLDVCRHLQIEGSKVVKFPELSSEDLQWAFIRGLFDGDGWVQDLSCGIASTSAFMKEKIGEISKVPHIIHQGAIEFSGLNALDFLGRMYNNCGGLRLARKYDLFIGWTTWKPALIIPECSVFKTDANAVLPSKPKFSDVGYDLTIIKEEKKWNNNTVLYDTGLKLKVAQGLYAEIVPRSSLSKSGYMLANSIGIIDPSYRGNIFIALTKVDPSAPNLELPFRCCQLIFRKQLHVELREVCQDFEETSRGEGGFGSSG